MYRRSLTAANNPLGLRTTTTTAAATFKGRRLSVSAATTATTAPDTTTSTSTTTLSDPYAFLQAKLPHVELKTNIYERNRHGKGESHHPTAAPDIVVTPTVLLPRI
jgi:hypothetical protein